MNTNSIHIEIYITVFCIFLLKFKKRVEHPKEAIKQTNYLFNERDRLFIMQSKNYNYSTRNSIWLVVFDFGMFDYLTTQSGSVSREFH